MGQLDNTIIVLTADNGAETQTYPDGGITPFKGGKLTTWEGGMRVPLLVRWPGVIKPGTVNNEIFSMLDWLPTLVDIAGGPKGNELKKQIEAGKYPGFVKTTLDGFNQRDFPGRQVAVRARSRLLLAAHRTVGSALQELEDVLRDGRFDRCLRADGARRRMPGRRSLTSGAIRSNRWSGTIQKAATYIGGAIASPSTAYLYDWQMLPIGQLLWLKELETYRAFPPLQTPAAYNLDEIVKIMQSSGTTGMGH